MDPPPNWGAIAKPTIMATELKVQKILRAKLVPLMAPLLRKPHQLLVKQRIALALKTFTVLVPYAHDVLQALPRMLEQIQQMDARVRKTHTGSRELETTPVSANLVLKVLLLFVSKRTQVGKLSLTKTATLSLAMMVREPKT
jgi:hypothetical protein